MNRCAALTIVVGMSLVLAACATPRQVADQNVNMSLAVEEANNRMLLLNVVRAYHRQPFHFFRVGVVRGPAGLGSVTTALPLPFGPDFTAQVYNFSAGYKPDQPSFDLTPLDSQEFMQGITKPISPRLIGYYLDQGWPRQLLLHMFVREIEIYENVDNVTRKTGRYLNYPQNEDDMQKFSRVVASLRRCEIDLAEEKVVQKHGPPLTLDQHTPIEKLAAARTNDLTLVEDNGKYQLQRISKVPTLAIRMPANASPEDCAFVRDQERDPAVAREALASAPIAALLGRNADDPSPPGAGAPWRYRYVFVLRSVEAMIYYLGELTRLQLDGPLDNGVADGSRRRAVEIGFEPFRSKPGDPLFVVRRGSAEPAAVSVEYWGEQYSIPRSAGRASHVLSLVTQLLGLQNKATEAPVTGVVRVAN